MADELRTQVDIRISRVEDSTRFAESQGSKGFWTPLIKDWHDRHSPQYRPEPPSVEVIEMKFKLSFGRSLKRQLIDYFLVQPSDSHNHEQFATFVSTLPAKYALLLPLVGFEVRSISYGSLDLSLEIAGIKNLVELFEGNFDLFMMFMQGYLPCAFDHSLREFEFFGDSFRFDVVPGPGVISAFTATKATPVVPSELPTTASPAPVNSDRFDRMKALWMVANYTLVVPVLLALAVVYVTAKGLAEERSVLQAIRKDLSAREQSLVKVATDRVIELEKSQSELMKTFRLLPQPAEKR